MPTPVAHALAGTAVYLAARQDPARKEDLVLLGGTVFAACAADLDFGISFLTSHNYHHYFTHSLGFATLFCLAAYFLAKWAAWPFPARDAWILGAAYLTHIVLDLFSKDTAAPFGVELLWPFSDAFTISPVLLFDDIWRGTLRELFGLHNWLAVAREVAIVGPVVAFVWWRRRKLVTESR